MKEVVGAVVDDVRVLSPSENDGIASLFSLMHQLMRVDFFRLWFANQIPVEMRLSIGQKSESIKENSVDYYLRLTFSVSMF